MGYAKLEKKTFLKGAAEVALEQCHFTSFGRREMLLSMKGLLLQLTGSLRMSLFAVLVQMSPFIKDKQPMLSAADAE